MLADLPNKSDKKQNALNTELSEFNTELKVISSSVYKADSEPIRDHWYYTFHSDDCPIFLKKNKQSAELGHLIQSASTGAFSPKALLHPPPSGWMPYPKGQ